MKSFLVIGNIVGSGLFALWLAYHFASGPLVVGRTDAIIGETDFFLLLPVWGAGAFLVWRYFLKKGWGSVTYMDIVLTNVTLWLTIPVGFYVSTMFI
ncbi:hypothetical protein GLV98_10915 [Halobacillus litoralis]|uniref:Uncharacterized protein n=1 Tax=Halobacillus litoralis TaxID=45668 RepID=A0A845EFK2_9BACI|nr:hypothetical protein [Halobacillus litoralis]MYL49998.1 hypothetical protein [Halobacillus litoralis]